MILSIMISRFNKHIKNLFFVRSSDNKGERMINGRNKVKLGIIVKIES